MLQTNVKTMKRENNNVRKSILPMISEINKKYSLILVCFSGKIEIEKCPQLAVVLSSII